MIDIDTKRTVTSSESNIVVEWLTFLLRIREDNLLVSVNELNIKNLSYGYSRITSKPNLINIRLCACVT